MDLYRKPYIARDKELFALANEKHRLNRVREKADAIIWDDRGKLVDPRAILNALETAACFGEVTEYIAFLKLADEIDLLGPFDIIVSAIKSAFKSQPLSLLGSHVCAVAEFPQSHPLRKLIAHTCVRDYIADTMAEIDPQGIQKQKSMFRFIKELEVFESFSSDLFREYRSCLAFRFKREGKLYIKDPQGRRLIKIKL